MEYKIRKLVIERIAKDGYLSQMRNPSFKMVLGQIRVNGFQ